MDQLLSAQNWINGLLLGSLYAVAAVGFAMIWGVLNIINIAQGAMMVTSAYLSLVLFSHFGIDPYLGLPINIAVFFALGWLLQRYVINLIVRAPMFMTLLLTFGLDLIITVMLLAVFHADPRQLNPSYSADSLRGFGVVLPLTRLIALAVAVAATALVSVPSQSHEARRKDPGPLQWTFRRRSW